VGKKYLTCLLRYAGNALMDSIFFFYNPCAHSNLVCAMCEKVCVDPKSSLRVLELVRAHNHLFGAHTLFKCAPIYSGNPVCQTYKVYLIPLNNNMTGNSPHSHLTCVSSELRERKADS
jgi:hypothetical protein